MLKGKVKSCTKSGEWDNSGKIVYFYDIVFEGDDDDVYKAGMQDESKLLSYFKVGSEIFYEENGVDKKGNTKIKIPKELPGTSNHQNFSSSGSSNGGGYKLDPVTFALTKGIETADFIFTHSPEDITVRKEEGRDSKKSFLIVAEACANYWYKWVVSKYEEKESEGEEKE